jgi:hypothetical protein
MSGMVSQLIFSRNIKMLKVGIFLRSTRAKLFSMVDRTIVMARNEQEIGTA